MPENGNELYLIKNGAKLDLAALNTSDKSLWPDLNKDGYEKTYDKLLDELRDLQKLLYAQQKHRVLLIIQAMDTGGKDGCINSVFSRIDPQGVSVQSFKKPTEEEAAHDFLWRVHPHVPRNGQLMIFNRSHYEDILAVRVKKLFPDEVWKRRYRHVVEFERMLAEEGTTILKVFLHISKDEQKRRLEARLANPAKHWKFNPDDLQDRARWGDFMTAYEDVISKTSTPDSPWFVIPADRKWYRNLCVAKLVVDTLKSLKMEYPKHTWNPADVHVE